MTKLMTMLAALLCCANLAFAGEALEYKSGGETLEGYLATPMTKRLNNPAVLIVHDWMGLSDATRKKADEMADLGYVALAVDVYGKGVRPKDPKEAGALAGKYKGNVKLLRERMQAALETLKKNPTIDPSNIVVFGYCFGGTAALELGRAGADVKGIVSFHGGLATPKPGDAKNIKGKVLVLHGAVDPHVKPAEVSAFQKAMDKAGVDYQLIAYSGAVHAFTSKEAGNDPKKGAAYNEVADRRSWEHFKDFLNEVAPL